MGKYIINMLVLFSVLSFSSITHAQEVIPEPDIYHQTGKFQWSEVGIASGVICWARVINGFSLYSIVKFYNVEPGTKVTMQGATCEKPTHVTAAQRKPWAEGHWGVGFTSVEHGAPTATPSLTFTVSLTPSLTRTPRPTNTVTLTRTSTATAVPAPWPTIIFKTRDNDNSTYFYTPQKNEMCSTWNPSSGRLGPFSIPSGKGLMIVKFLEDQETIPVSVTWCEAESELSVEERVSFHIKDQPSVNSWNNSTWFYVGSNMSIVTLTPTGTETNTPSVTSTSTVTATSSATSTSSVTASNTPLPTATVTRSRTSTPSRTITPTRSKTPTATESLGPNVIVQQGVSTLVRPKVGNVCYGEIVGNQARVIIEFVENYNSGIEISGGGCFTSNNYSLSQILRYLESRGIKYSFSSLPKPTLTPSRTLVPTATIVSYIHIGVYTDRTKNMILQPGTICWGNSVGSFEYKVVKYHKGTTSPIRVTNGGCYLGDNLSAEDVYNYLRRRLNLPLNGFVEVR